MSPLSESSPSDSDGEALSDVLGHVYDAALEPALWPLVIEKTCGYLHCSGGVIAHYDILYLDGSMVWAWGYEQPYLDAMADSFKSIGLVRESLQMKIGEVATLSEAIPIEAYYKTDPYLRWASPQGIVDSLQVMLERTATSAVLMGFARRAEHGLVDALAQKRLSYLTPHLRRAVLIGKTLEQKRIEATAFADTIDGLAAGVFVVDADCRLIHANTSGEAMLGKAVLQLKGGVLSANDTKVGRMLHAVVEAAGRGNNELATYDAIAFCDRNGERFVANVLPLNTGRRRAVTPRAASAAIFVGSTSVKFPLPVKTIAAEYDLTAAETRILHLILEIQGVPAAAAMLGVSIATVKTHLRGIFRKTGARGQADLVKLAAGYASPLATPL